MFVRLSQTGFPRCKFTDKYSIKGNHSNVGLCFEYQFGTRLLNYAICALFGGFTAPGMGANSTKWERASVKCDIK